MYINLTKMKLKDKLDSKALRDPIPLEAKLMICKDKLGHKALRDPRTLRELKVRNDWERVRRILIRRYKRYD